VSTFLSRALRPRKNAYKEYHIGPHKIILPKDHPLDSYQRTFPRYDIALGEIARAIIAKYPHATAIDIGANIGDSAALICKYQSMPVLCIEGNVRFIPFLRENASRIGNNIFIENSFVGINGMAVDRVRIEEKRGTASILDAVQANKGKDTIPMRSLDAILKDFPAFSKSKLLKIDADGFDFQIISNSLGMIRALQSVIFFEYAPNLSKKGDQESLSAIRSLTDADYYNFIVYDNFGNYLISINEVDQFADLNIYLRSNEANETIVYYFDVCAFHANDYDLFQIVRRNERQLGQ